ncbi:MAG: FAD-binding oxidoreductase, partial [Alphaproteobacteria bacterium]
MPASAANDAALIGRLQAIVGQAHVINDESERDYFAQDVYGAGAPPLAVVQPADTTQLAATVKAATEAGLAVIPRGGGMSYTGGYLSPTSRAVTIDIRRMNRVLEINLQDMYVTVECGCTWHALHEALKDKGVRPPFWGTLSGLQASIGGGLSQNSIFFGSGQHGSAADSVIGLDVVLADGTVLRTGTAGVKGAAPFWRHYGPDLSGLFTADAGALGIKAVATLKLIADPAERRFASFGFDALAPMLTAMSEISRRGLASECFGFDPNLQAQRMKRESLVADVKALAGVMQAASSFGGAIKDAVKLALAGRSYMKTVRYSCHVASEHRYAGAADAALAEIRAVARAAGGREIENAIPKIVRANPFTPLNNMIGPNGERWVPIHGVVPHSKAPAMCAAIEALFACERQALEKYDILTGYLYATIGASAMVIEPVFFWPDALTVFHQRHVE